MENLIAQLRSLSTALTDKELLDALQDFIGEGITMRYEFMDGSGAGTSNYDPTRHSQSQYSSSNKSASQSHSDHPPIGRVILSAIKKKSDLSRELVRQCNGCVLEFRTWRVLTRPTEILSGAKGKISCLDEYTVYEIKDGTTVNLYWYGDKWCMGTANGYEMNAVHWIGPHNYEQAFMQAAKSFPKFSLNALNRNHGYTIGFRHADFHPLRDEKTPKMWLLQCVKLATGEVLEEDIGIPIQQPAALPQGSSEDIVKWLESTNAKSLDVYLETGVPHYGYVLRRKYVQTDPMKHPADRILESLLLKQVRWFVYDLPKRQTNHVLNIDHNNRMEYSCLKNYLCYEYRDQFVKLFPQMNKYYNKFNGLFEQLRNRVMDVLKRKTSTRANTPLTLIADEFVKNLSAYVNANDPNTPKIVMDYICNVEYTDWYFKCLVVPK